MHSYAIFDHDRVSIGRWLGVVALFISIGISQGITELYKLTGWEAFTQLTITAGIVYFGLHWIFNKIVWKYYFSKIPDLSGTWAIDGKTLDERGNTKYEWPALLDIEQNWTKISIALKTKKSQSQSYTATLFRASGTQTGWVLSYSYKNAPELEQTHELHSHKGFCEVEFDKNLNSGKATYFNSAGRKTYGIMTLLREEKI